MTILSSIEHLKDQLNKLDKNTNTYKFKSNDNVIKSEGDTFRFVRFDTISTHIEQSHSDKSLKDIYECITSKLDYDLEFATERTELVNRLVEENEWIYTLISTERLIKNQIKKKTSFLSENMAFDKLMERLSTFINHAKFIDEIDKAHYEALIENLQELEKVDKRKRDELHDSELLKLADQIQSYHHKLLREELTEQMVKSKRVESSDNLANRETKGDFVTTEEQQHRIKKITKNIISEELAHDYWDTMFSQTRKGLIPWYDTDMHDESMNKSILSKTFRKESIEQLEKTVENIAKLIHFDVKDTKKRQKMVEKIIKKKGKRYYSQLRKMYVELKGDTELAKRILTVIVVPKKLEKTSTVIDINSNTYYTNEQGEEIELSKNYIRMSDANTYKGLILTYKDLAEKYYDSHDSDWWVLIKIFEDLLNKTSFTKDEQFVLDMLFDNYSQTQIRENYGNLNVNGLSTYRISNLINTVIPNKMRETYLNSVEDWLYDSKIKGVYKSCAKCNEIKILNERHYRKRADNKGDGYRNSCRICESGEKA